MHIDELILNMRATYKDSKDANDNKFEETMRREFEHYKPEKLDNVWAAVRRHHKAAWMPIIGQILECMDKADVKEYKSKEEGNTWNQCTTCGCNYSLKSRLCPDCNRPLPDGEIFRNDLIIVKGFKYKANHVTCNDNCSICPTFKKNRMSRGARCQGWSKELYEREPYNCEGCPCAWCCNEKAIHDEEHSVGTLMKHVISQIKR